MTVRQGKRRFQGESEVQAQLLIGATQLECGANLQREGVLPDMDKCKDMDNLGMAKWLV